MKASSRAFSLVEVLLATCILLAGLAGLASAIPELGHVQEHQRHLADASTVAGNVLEDAIFSNDANTLTGGTTTGRYNAQGLADTGGMYVATRTVADHQPIGQSREIDVVVHWDEWGRDKTYALRTYAFLQ